MLPTSDMELVSTGDTAVDIVLLAGFNAVSLNITAIDGFTRIFFNALPFHCLSFEWW